MTERRKQMLMIWLPVLVCLAGILILNNIWQQRYEQAAFGSVSSLSQIILEKDPKAGELLLSSLKEYTYGEGKLTGGDVFLKQYGYTSEDFAGGTGYQGAAAALFTAVLISAVFILSVWFRGKRKQARISGLTKYLEQVNIGAGGTMFQAGEDEFSHLQDEIYKTVTSLYATREAAIKARERFADHLADIAHQLKTPLTAAFLSLQLMEKSASNPYIKTLQNQLGRLNRLEEALLTLSRIDSGTLKLEHSDVDVYTVLNLAADNLEELLAEKEVRVEIPDKSCAGFQGDMEWTMEALINLMKNSMEHSPRGSVIHCDYSQNLLYTEILIRDEGPGFDPEDLPHLFERFYRGKSSGKDGMGIGLALAHSIFELQGGSLTARNLPSGGACFEIRIYSH